MLPSYIRQQEIMANSYKPLTSPSCCRVGITGNFRTEIRGTKLSGHLALIFTARQTRASPLA